MLFKTTLFYDIKKYFYKPVGGNPFFHCGPEKKLAGAETISK